MSKNILLIVIGLIVGLGLGALIASKESPIDFAGFNTPQTVVVGSQTSFDRLPSEAVHANTTTTVAGDLVTQRFHTEEGGHVRLNVSAKGANATSTAYIQPFVSYDGLYFYTLSTSTVALNSTSTVPSTFPALEWTPGTASSSKSFVWETQGAEYFRFVIWGDDLAADPTDGVNAYAEVIVEKEIVDTF